MNMVRKTQENNPIHNSLKKGINVLIKEMKDFYYENCKTLEEHTRRWKNVPCS
jgi:hypothetical protein